MKRSRTSITFTSARPAGKLRRGTTTGVFRSTRPRFDWTLRPGRRRNRPRRGSAAGGRRNAGRSRLASAEPVVEGVACRCDSGAPVSMEWTDEGIVLGVRRHGEANAILEVVTSAHGRHLGLVRGGTGARLRPVLQPGNSVRVVWRARLDEHLGNFAVEGLRLRAAAFLPAAHAVYGVTHLAALCRLLPERDPHPAIYGTLEAILDRMDDCDAVAARLARFELMLLAELGFGLDLATCTATGQ